MPLAARFRHSWWDFVASLRLLALRSVRYCKAGFGPRSMAVPKLHQYNTLDAEMDLSDTSLVAQRGLSRAIHAEVVWRTHKRMFSTLLMEPAPALRVAETRPSSGRRSMRRRRDRRGS